MTPNITSGTVTNRRDHVPARVTARKVLKRTLIIAALVFVAMLAFGLTLNALAGDLTPNKSLPACKSEDQTDCYWDADTAGNGRGHDVVTP